jgi:hypothetical protein
MHFIKSVLLLTGISLLAPAAISFGLEEAGPGITQERSSERVMLILRGIANDDYPRGALDDEVTLEYAAAERLPPAIVILRTVTNGS